MHACCETTSDDSSQPAGCAVPPAPCPSLSAILLGDILILAKGAHRVHKPQRLSCPSLWILGHFMMESRDRDTIAVLIQLFGIYSDEFCLLFQSKNGNVICY